MINFRKTIALGLLVASLGMGVAATFTPAAAWEIQHGNMSSGFQHEFQYWGPGIGGTATSTSYYVYNPCSLTTKAIVDDYGFTYYSTVSVCDYRR